MKKNLVNICVSFLFFALTFSACEREAEVFEERDEVTFNEAVAVIHPVGGSNVTGVVNFLQTETGIQVIADIDGLSDGEHGFHIHEFGDCRADDAETAGGHFNPDSSKHGSPADEERHVGDLGNISALSNQTAHYERVDERISFSGKSSIIGRAIVIHQGADDFTSQPSGNSGSRIACGVIGIANPNY